MVIGPHTTWCQVSDMQRSVTFYRDVLGLTPGVVSPYWSDFALGGMKLGLHPRLTDAADPLGVEGKGWYLGLETDDLKALVAKVEGSEGAVVGGFHQTPSGVVATLVDPDGNPLQAVQPGSKMSDFE